MTDDGAGAAEHETSAWKYLVQSPGFRCHKRQTIDNNVISRWILLLGGN